MIADPAPRCSDGTAARDTAPPRRYRGAPHMSDSGAAGRSHDARALRAAWFVFVAIAVGVHVVYPAARPMHNDSMMTGGKVLLPWDALFADTRTNAFEPAFYFAMKAWCDVAGVSARALLAPAGLCAVARSRSRKRPSACGRIVSRTQPTHDQRVVPSAA